MTVKANQPALLGQVTAALAGTDAEFAAVTWTEEGKGHGRHEKRSIRTAPAGGHWISKEIAYGITSLPPELAGPRYLAIYARQHWAIENRQHY
jgi:hypothetical protein